MIWSLEQQKNEMMKWYDTQFIKLNQDLQNVLLQDGDDTVIESLSATMLSPPEAGLTPVHGHVDLEYTPPLITPARSQESEPTPLDLLSTTPVSPLRRVTISTEVLSKVESLRTVRRKCHAEQALSVIRDWAKSNRKRMELEAVGAIAAVISTMQKYPSSVAVQRNGLGFFLRMGVNELSRTVIAASGGIDAILSAMERHASIVEVQIQSCGALMLLALDDNNKVIIGAADGITKVLTVMQRHSDVAGVQSYCCGILINLAGTPHNQMLISAQGGIDSILEAMRLHQHHVRVQEYGCGALLNLSTSNSNNKEMIAIAGGIEAVLSAIQNYPFHATIQHYGCMALSLLEESQHDARTSIPRSASF